MSRFFVGQRVRIKYSEHWPQLAGQEGRVLAVGITSFSLSGEPDSECLSVAPDCWGTNRSPDGAGRFAPDTGQVEPILPEGHQPARWEDCMWQPEHLRETAHG